MFEDTQGVIRGYTPKNDIQKEIEDTKGVISTRSSKKDMQEEFEYIIGVTMAVHRRMTDTKGLKIHKE